jgi:hypothetical protein
LREIAKVVVLVGGMVRSGAMLELQCCDDKALRKTVYVQVGAEIIALIVLTGKRPQGNQTMKKSKVRASQGWWRGKPRED